MSYLAAMLVYSCKQRLRIEVFSSKLQPTVVSVAKFMFIIFVVIVHRTIGIILLYIRSLQLLVKDNNIN